VYTRFPALTSVGTTSGVMRITAGMDTVTRTPTVTVIRTGMLIPITGDTITTIAIGGVDNQRDQALFEISTIIGIYGAATDLLSLISESSCYFKSIYLRWSSVSFYAPGERFGFGEFQRKTVKTIKME